MGSTFARYSVPASVRATARVVLMGSVVPTSLSRVAMIPGARGLRQSELADRAREAAGWGEAHEQPEGREQVTHVDDE